MAVTHTSFIASFPELEPAGPTLIGVKISEAERRIGSDGIWGLEESRDLGVLYRAAHLLALSPYGMQAKMVSKDGSTTYGRHYEDLVNELGCGFIVLK